MLEYNYNFLREWIAQTRTTYKEVMQAVGNSSSNNLHDWLGDGPAQKRQAKRGETIKPVAMNTESMIRFCNYFKLPIGVFFMKDGKPLSSVQDKTHKTLKQLDKRLSAIEELLKIGE